MKKKIVARIANDMKHSGVCSIISDGTKDVRKVEASYLLIRYIEDVDKHQTTAS